MAPSRRPKWRYFDPEKFARRHGIPIFDLEFDRLMGCFVRLRREDGGPDRVGIGLREDLVNDRSLLREYHRTLLHELGHWATTVGVLLPVAGFQETEQQLSSGIYLSSKPEVDADLWAMRKALGIDPRRPKADGGLGGTPLLLDELEEEFGYIDAGVLLEAADRTMLPFTLIEHWSQRCEQLGLKKGSNWGRRQLQLPFDN